MDFIYVELQVVIKEYVIAGDDMIFCIDMAVPSFNYRPSVTRLYLERVQLLELAPIFKALPNLLYLSLVDMEYFSCSWMGGYSPKYCSHHKYVYG